MRIKYSTDVTKLKEDKSLCILMMSNNDLWIFERNINDTIVEYTGSYYNNGKYVKSFPYLFSNVQVCFEQKKYNLSCYIITKETIEILKTSLALTKDYKHWLRRLKDILEHD